MCSRFLKHHEHGGRHSFVDFIDGLFDRLHHKYQRVLHAVLNNLPVVGIFVVIILTLTVYLSVTAKSELAPAEDPGFIIAMSTGSPNSTLGQTLLNSHEVRKIISSYPEVAHQFQLAGTGSLNMAISGMVLKPWDERKRSAKAIAADVQVKLGGIAGLNTVSFMPPPLPGGGGGMPIQFVIGTTDDFSRLNDVAAAVTAKAMQSGMFMFLDTDLKIDKPQVSFDIDREKAAQLGLSMKEIGSSLGAMVGGGYVNYFSLAGRSYKVIPQIQQKDRLNPEQLKDIYIRTGAGAMIPLSTVVTTHKSVVPESLSHFQQMNSATVGGVAMPGVPQGQAIDALQKIAKETMPQGYRMDYGGQSRQYVKESSSMTMTFFLAILIIFLVLAALFESFRDPLIVLISVPMSICGAMMFISLGIGGATLNIYTQVGLVTLVGLISKHGILIVQFANDLRKEGKAKRDAIEEAAAIRLRPILMTTAAMVFGTMPLVMAAGAGAAGRFNMGLVITTGIAIGTLFTLFVVPSMYMFLSKEQVNKL